MGQSSQELYRGSLGWSNHTPQETHPKDARSADTNAKNTLHMNLRDLTWTRETSLGLENPRLDSRDPLGLERPRLDSRDPLGLERPRLDSRILAWTRETRLDSRDLAWTRETRLDSRDLAWTRETSLGLARPDLNKSSWQESTLQRP